MAEAAEEFPKPSEVLASFARQDEITALLAIATVRQLEHGDSEMAKQRLLSVIGIYYSAHRTNDLYTNMIAQIEKAALKSPSIAAQISKKGD